MAGKYIINQTAGKRYIILEEDAEKIEGGYFDTEGVWHALSGPLDGDLLGKYVINETGGKRIILLEEDANEIGGGYFEEDGTWVSFESVIEVDVTKMSIYTLKNSSPYTEASTTRLSYAYFDVFLDPDSTYQVLFEGTEPGAACNAITYNELAYSKATNGQSMSASDVKDHYWLASGDTFTTTAFHGYPVKGVRFAFRKNENNETISENFLTSLKLVKVE